MKTVIIQIMNIAIWHTCNTLFIFPFAKRTKYKPTTAKTRTAINARLNEGFTLDNFKTVIDKKCAEWIGTEYEKYLRPETLFGTKFEGYLNAKAKSGGKDDETPDFLKKWSV